ncbi:hypothetical protein [Methylocapsa sp. S129]|uniref:hypothetical protein n=1 Tax=Methylocapsa sp. S129 TaxID=1641869 RepID=UPI00131E6E9E|nr:hypothetical protein [Methylocapsa sp. S129]
MNEPARQAPRRKPQMNAHERELRRRRIFRQVQDGLTHEEIAEAEGLTRQRIRQIVAQSIERRVFDTGPDYLRMQVARLDPALRLAAAKVADGDLRAVHCLIKVLDRIDKYRTAGRGMAMVDEDDAAKFDAKLADLVQRADDQRAREAAAAAAVAEEAARAGEAATAATGAGEWLQRLQAAAAPDFSPR